jgi:hypothetical protein
MTTAAWTPRRWSATAGLPRSGLSTFGRMTRTCRTAGCTWSSCWRGWHRRARRADSRGLSPWRCDGCSGWRRVRGGLLWLAIGSSIDGDQADAPSGDSCSLECRWMCRAKRPERCCFFVEARGDAGSDDRSRVCVMVSESVCVVATCVGLPGGDHTQESECRVLAGVVRVFSVAVAEKRGRTRIARPAKNSLLPVPAGAWSLLLRSFWHRVSKVMHVGGTACCAMAAVQRTAVRRSN